MSHVPGNLMTPNKQKRQRSKFVAHLVTTLGGANAGVHSAFKSYLYRSAYDNPNELENLADLYRELDVKTFPLALCKTIDSLFLNSDNPVAHHLPTISNSNSRKGLSARGSIGGQAGYLIATSKEHDESLQAMRNLVTIEKRGQIHAIVHDYLIAFSGGTAPAFISIIEAFERDYSSLGIAVEIRIHAVGYLGMIGASAAGPMNDPCARAAIISYVTSKAPPLIVRSLRLFEQPTLGPLAAQERTRFNTLYYQAIQSEDARRHFDLVESNDATESTLGNISFRHIDITQAPESINAIRADAARQMLANFEHLTALPKPNLSILRQETWLNRTIRHRHFNVDHLVDNHWMSPCLLIQEATERIEESEPSVIFDVPHLGRIDVSAIDHIVGEPLETEGDLKIRQLLLVTLQAYLRLRIAELERNEPALVSVIAKGAKSLKSVLQKAASTKNPGKRHKTFSQVRRTLLELRRLSDTRFLIEDKLRRLRIAQRLTVEAQHDLDETLNLVKNAINDCIFRLGPESRTGLAATPSAGFVLPSLLRLPHLPADQQLAKFDSFAALITRYGLQEIVKSTQATIESIADAIVFAEPTFSSPSLGNEPYSYGGPTLYVLPALEQEDADLVESAIRKRDQSALVSFLEDNDCGAAIVKIKVRHFDTVRSLLPGELANNLARVLMSDRAILRFPRGMDCLDHLGIRLDRETGALVFEKLRPVRN